MTAFTDFKTNYIISHLHNIKHKNTETYVIQRIIDKLDDFSLKPVFQQYVARPNGKRALVDLYYPILKFGVEVNEEYHNTQIEADSVRNTDIADVAGITLVVVDAGASQTLPTLNAQIDKIVNRIKDLKSELGEKFIPWEDDGKDLYAEHYIKKGYVDADEYDYFKTVDEITKAFGAKSAKRGYKVCGAVRVPWLDKTFLLWPNLNDTKVWDNKFNDDHTIWTEKNADATKNAQHVVKTLAKEHVRIVFAKEKDVFGKFWYRYVGNYELDVAATNAQNALVWKRIATRQDIANHL